MRWADSDLLGYHEGKVLNIQPSMTTCHKSMQFYDVLMKADRKIIGFKFKNPAQEIN